MELTEEQFHAIKFIPNHIDNNASWQDENGIGIMFETYGEEVEYVKSLVDSNRVWTLIDVDYGMSVIAGWAFVNRIGYFISEEPWPNLDTFFYMPNEFECEQCHIEMLEEDNLCLDCDEETCHNCCTDKEHIK